MPPLAETPGAFQSSGSADCCNFLGSLGRGILASVRDDTASQEQNWSRLTPSQPGATPEAGTPRGGAESGPSPRRPEINEDGTSAGASSAVAELERAAAAFRLLPPDICQQLVSEQGSAPTSTSAISTSAIFVPS